MKSADGERRMADNSLSRMCESRPLSAGSGMIGVMSENAPEASRPVETSRELSHVEEKSFTGSAQAIGIEPSETFVAPTMAVDAFEPESD